MNRLTILALALTSALGLFAQHNEEVTIEGTYRPKVNKVDKILTQPQTPQQSFDMPSTEVKVLEIDHRFPLNLDKVGPMAFNGKNGHASEATKNFLMAGFGSRISPVFLYKHNSNLTKNLGLGVGIKHYSSWLDMKNYGPSSFMDNAFDIGLSSKLNNLQLGGKVFYKNDMYHYYGYHPSPANLMEPGYEDADRQIYNTIGAHVGLASTTTRNGEFSHQLGLDYHYLFGRLDGGGKEHFAGLNYDLCFTDSWWGKKNHPQKLGVALGVQYDKTVFAGQVGDDRLAFKVNPYFEMKDDYYRLHLGVRMDGATEFGPSNPFLSVHPDVRGSLLVLNNSLEFYAALNGGRKLYTYADFIDENPFVATRLNMAVTTVKLGFEGGVRTNIMNTVDVHVGVRYRHTDNDPFYSQHYSMNAPHNSFDLVYDETRLVSVLGNIRWLAMDKLTVDAGITYNSYTMTQEQHPWYRPGLQGNLKLDCHFTDAFAMNMNFLYQGNRWAQETVGGQHNAVKMKDVFDLGLGADYHINSQLTVFAKLDNVANQQYQLYYDYPVTGIQFFAGLKLRF